MQAGLADLVVRRALLLAAQHLVRLRHFLEVLLRRPRVARIFVGVVLDRELLVRRLDLRVRRAAWHAEHLVVVVAIQLLLRHVCVETRRARVGTSPSRPFEVRTVNAMCPGERQPGIHSCFGAYRCSRELSRAPMRYGSCNGTAERSSGRTRTQIAIRAELARKRCVVGDCAGEVRGLVSHPAPALRRLLQARVSAWAWVGSSSSMSRRKAASQTRWHRASAGSLRGGFSQ